MAALDLEDQLQESISQFINRPYDFVIFSYPWQEPGPLENESGPDEWQEKVLKDLQSALETGIVNNQDIDKHIESAIQIAVRSGHGVGKSCLISWLIDWFMSTRPNPQIVCTANTKEQLETKTWREKAKWHKLLINKHWFKISATKYVCLAEPDTWFAKALPWSKDRPEAFAGTHEENVLMIMDEASAIDDIIWEVVEGAMTDINGTRIWIAFGNPTRNTGRFSQCFKKLRKYWLTYEVDARTSNRTDKKKHAQWAEQYGEDSDFFRVRVKGQEPRTGVKQYIGDELVEKALGKQIHISNYYNRPKILGVDIARFGDDRTVFIKRQGLAMYGMQKFRGLKTQDTAGRIADIIRQWEPDMVFLDMGNIGASVYDILEGWGFKDVITGIWFQNTATDKATYFNIRVEMIGKLKEWLENGGCLPEDTELRDDFTGPEIGFSNKEQFQLEGAKDMKARGLDSPDCLFAAGLTFAYPVMGKANYDQIGKQAVTEYNMFSERDRQPKTVDMNYDQFNRRNG
jgi:hypothetical protein